MTVSTYCKPTLLTTINNLLLVYNIIELETLGTDLVPFAKHEKDLSIEGFMHLKFPIKGVMWHPERKQDNNSLNLLEKIFK